MARVPEEQITTRQAAEAARDRLHGLGYPHARLADELGGPVDVLAPEVVARVVCGTDRVAVEPVVALAGLAAEQRRTGCLFSVAGFTDEAIAWADRADIALFVFDRVGEVEPVGRVAAEAVARCTTVEPTFGTGFAADPVQVASVLTEGLVGGRLGSVSLWFGGLGRLVAFRLDPGSREVPARIRVDLYPPVLPQPVELDAGWEFARRRLPGGGKEELWTRECVHANQPPTVVAGEAVLHARLALAAHGVELERGRVELRRAPDREEDVQREARAARESIVGPLVHDDTSERPRGERATPDRIVALLLDLAAEADGQIRDLEVAGRDDEGETAWQLVARRGRRATAGETEWHIEARLPAETVADDGGRSWLRAPTKTIGTTRWKKTGGWWRTVDSGADLAVVAHEVVADLAAAYAVAGRALDRTALPEP